ncbi:hypothetical protein M5C99_13545 [Acidovorax sp. NCPPB 2350]|nr:hypothetical protein M5C99_13545 [Acidovorax sp. NCPPB 2350]
MGANAATAPPQIFYIHADHLNTPRVVVDKANTVRWRWMSEPFGTTAAETSPAGQADFVFNLRFPGQYYDVESGIHQNWNRDYIPGLGRYAQSDPIGLNGGINTYGYVGGNPLSRVDPSGKIAIVDDAAVWTVIGVGIIVMSPPVQNAIRNTVDAIANACKPTDPCEELTRQARDIAGKLRSKIAQQLTDKYHLYDNAFEEGSNPGGILAGKGTWMGHSGQIDGLKVGLMRKIAELQGAGCPVPPDILMLATTPNPTKPGGKP